MKTPWRKTSRPRHIICTGCGSGKLQLQAPELASCDSCGYTCVRRKSIWSESTRWRTGSR